ncbi:MAG TPA: hypothetical protein VF681_10465 [Abditibacteriaceae bacterium]|jgi:hypothetical protein
MNNNESKLNTYEKIRFAIQSLFILPFLPLLFLMMVVLDWSDKKIPSPPGTSKLRSCLFWMLFLIICVACWGYFGGWLLHKIAPR